MTGPKFTLNDFKSLPKKQQQAVYMIVGCVFVFLTVVITSTVLVFRSSPVAAEIPSSVMQVESNYNKDAAVIDVEEYKGIILQEGKDAGESYLDETLWVGDSNTVRMNLYGLVPLSNYMGKVGMSSSGITTVQCVYFQGDSTAYTIPKAIAKVQPRRIIISFGTNDASGSMTADSFAKVYKKGIAAIQEAYPYADIIVASIPPVAQERAYPNIKMATIDEYNKALVGMCEELELPFLNTTELLKGSDGFIKDEYISEDGLHYSEAGVRGIMKYARTHGLDTEDRRPPVTNVPNRKEPPVEVTSIPQPPTVTTTTTSSTTSSSSNKPASSVSVSVSSNTTSGSQSHKHDFSHLVTKLEATTSAPGYQAYICTICGLEDPDTTRRIPIPQLTPSTSSTPAPSPSTPAPSPSTPAPSPSTPAPVPSTPAPAPSTPAPSTPVVVPSTPATPPPTDPVVPPPAEQETNPVVEPAQSPAPTA